MKVFNIHFSIIYQNRPQTIIFETYWSRISILFISWHILIADNCRIYIVFSQLLFICIFAVAVFIKMRYSFSTTAFVNYRMHSANVSVAAPFIIRYAYFVCVLLWLSRRMITACWICKNNHSRIVFYKYKYVSRKILRTISRFRIVSWL